MNKLRVKDTSSFVTKARIAQAERYIYEKSVYIDQCTPICIICDKHGEFWQQPKLHLKGHGCPRCGHEYRGLLNSKSKEHFIGESNELYQNFFNYSDVTYINSSTKVNIICPRHGPFWQTPNNHLSGHGCKVCNGYSVFNTASFICNANKIYDSKFDYSLTAYSNSHTKITIVCKKHGEFFQKPNTHLNGHGCPMCKESKGERIIRNFLLEQCVSFKSQYRIPACRNILSLPFDFAIFDKTLALKGLIEFQGAQHFIKSSFGSSKPSKDTLSEIHKRDSIKVSYCEQHSIPLLIIPYWDKDEIYKKVLDFLNAVDYKS